MVSSAMRRQQLPFFPVHHPPPNPHPHAHSGPPQPIAHCPGFVSAKYLSGIAIAVVMLTPQAK
ncbi:GM15470 [Drosophila sechellia]|uniref:GM15470 n=1 Tax=Drosophila sechellia TaxID=7238 RepID=B4HXE5_DROSE|nr:GM15470 [Drosophila sechellia]